MQQLLSVPEIELEDFGPFVGRHVHRLPDSGLALLKGEVVESGDGSGAGKSIFAAALAYLFGGCKHPATELQCWYADGAPTVEAPLVTPAGTYRVRRGKGLVVTPPAGKPLRGGAAEDELDRVFGMDGRMRAAVTYRGQDDTAGSLLSMSDPDKKAFLARLLQLDRYERVAAEAAAQAKALTDQLEAMAARLEEAQLAFDAAARAEAAALPGNDPAVLEAEALRHDAEAAFRRREVQEVKAQVEAARLAAGAELERAVAALDGELKELARRPESAELASARAALAEYHEAEDLVEARAKLKKVCERLDRVRSHDAEARAAHESARSDLRARLSNERAAQRELVRLEGVLAEKKAQEAVLAAANCPTCRQTWVDEAALVALEQLRGEVGKLTLDIFAKGVVDAEVIRLETELAAWPAYTGHWAGPQLQAARTELEDRLADLVAADAAARQELRTCIETLGDGRAAEHDAAAERIDVAKRTLRTQAGIRYQRDTQLLLEQAVRKEQQAQAAEAAARSARAEAGRQRTVTAVHAERLKAVDAASERLEQLKTQHAELEKRVNLELDLHAMVGREGFLGVIFEDVLGEIAAATNDILGRVANVRAVTFQFETERESKSGSVTTAITPVINLRGRRLAFSSPGLSGGMRASVRLAVDLGVGEVVAKRRGSYPGWLVLDETFNGLGPASKESCFEVLEAYAGQRLIMVVDHDTRFQGIFSQQITIKQVDGRSKIC